MPRLIEPLRSRGSSAQPAISQAHAGDEINFLITMHLGAGGNIGALLTLAFFVSLIGNANASLGDHLPDFKECVQVRRRLKRNPPLGTQLMTVGL